MGQLVMLSGNNIPFHGTLPNGTQVILEYLDIGENVREDNMLEPWGRPGGIMTASQDRTTFMEMQLHFKGTTIANMKLDSERIRNELSVANVLSYSPSYPEIPLRGIQTFRSPVPPWLGPDNTDNMRYLVTQLLVLDWRIRVRRMPYYQGDTDVPMI